MYFKTSKIFSFSMMDEKDASLQLLLFIYFIIFVYKLFNQISIAPITPTLSYKNGGFIKSLAKIHEFIISTRLYISIQNMR